MDVRHPLPHTHGPDVHERPTRVHPPLRRLGRLCARRCAKQPPRYGLDGEQRFGAVFHRGRTRSCATHPFSIYLFIYLFYSVVAHGESIASEGKGEYLYIEGTVRGTNGQPVSDAVIDTWETDANGLSLLLEN